MSLQSNQLRAELPNILFILTEDQGPHISHVGTPGVETPHMDSLAQSGTYFRNAFVAYLAAIEETDAIVGQGLDALKESGQDGKTIVVFMGDHGPCFQHGKMSLYELGLRVPLVIRVPKLPVGDSNALASELDLMPTLLDLAGLGPLATSHGISLRPVLERRPNTNERKLVFAEISNLGPLPNAGMQERSVSDGHWKLIYRENVETKWRQVNADLKDPKPWGNRSYHETVRVKDEFPEAYRVLQEMDPQSLDGIVPRLELYDLEKDPDEMKNLAEDPRYAKELDRLVSSLCQWVKDTMDIATTPDKLPRL